MERINRTARLMIGLIGLGTLAAIDPATQPAASVPAPAAAATPAPVPAMTPAAAPAADARGTSRQDRSNRRDRTSGRGGSASVVAGSTGSGGTGDAYVILRTRSIFIKGNQSISDASPSRPTFVSTGTFTSTPESALVFNGVIMVSDQANAMIEDTGSRKVSLVRAGDAIASGKITAVTFDDLTYEASGHVNHVSLGQNLSGITPAYVPPVAVATPTSQPAGATPPGDSAPVAGTPPTGGPPPGGSGGSGGLGGPPSITPGGAPAGASSAADILARLKAKRNQELGIK